MGRAPCCQKVGLKRGRWTAEEDQLLLDYIKANGEGSWRSLPKNAGLLRCGKSCRLRWINYLRPDLKLGNISDEEEETILKLRATLGNRWSLIASHLPGRTDNEIKNYWNSHLSKMARQAAAAGSNTTTQDSGKRKRGGGNGQSTAKRRKKTTATRVEVSKKITDKDVSEVETGEGSKSLQPRDDGPHEGTPGSTSTVSCETCVDPEWGPCGSDKLREMERELEEVVQQVMEGSSLNAGPSSSSLTEEDHESGASAKETSCDGEGESDGFLGLENIPWEDDEEVWQWLCDGENLSLDEEVSKIPEDIFGNNFDSWLLPDIP